MEIIGQVLWLATSIALLWVVWNVNGWPKVQLKPRKPPRSGLGGNIHFARVSILVPCRDEEENLPGLLENLMQQGREVAEILLLDDQSSDLTAAVIEEYALRDTRIRLIRGRQRPEGWFGKSWASKQLAEEAACPWMLYLDADVRLAKGAVPAILEAAREYNVTYLSCWPRFETVSAVEQVSIPLLNFATFTSFPMAAMHRSMHEGTIVASGACMLMERQAYEKIGGHSVCAHGLLEDHAFARGWRAGGERSMTLDGQDVVSVRMYQNLSEIVNGFRKNFYKVLRYGWVFWSFMVVQSSLYLAPFALAPLATLVGVPTLHLWMAAVNVLLIRLILAAAYRTPLWSAVVHPLAMVGMLYVAMLSFGSIALGIGVSWKGRTYFADRKRTIPAGLAALAAVEPAHAARKVSASWHRLVDRFAA